MKSFAMWCVLSCRCRRCCCCRCRWALQNASANSQFPDIAFCASRERWGALIMWKYWHFSRAIFPTMQSSNFAGEDEPKGEGWLWNGKTVPAERSNLMEFMRKCPFSSAGFSIAARPLSRGMNATNEWRKNIYILHIRKRCRSRMTMDFQFQWLYLSS